ncbi:MAG TPA: RDD family protein [Thermoanaerobaculia bacterium]|nr:RDD family protein [Thermoanaerobaculia bacterium]
MARFDEIELIKEPTADFPPLRPLPPLAIAVPEPQLGDAPATAAPRSGAPFHKRALGFLTDISLLLALALALTPLLPQRATLEDTLAVGWPAISAMAAFLLLVSWYYFAGSWIIWGRTVGAAIFDTRIVSMDGAPPTVGAATRRWLWAGISLLTLGLPFLVGLFGERRTLAERMSGTRTVGA